MKNLVAAFITSLLVFTLATAWIDLVQPQLDILAQAKTKALHGAKKSSQQRTDLADADDGDEDLTDEPGRKSRSKSSKAKSAKADAVSRERLLAELEEVKHREEKLIERQATMELLYQDIRRELAQVEDIRRRSAAEIALAQKQAKDAVTTNNPAMAAQPAAPGAKTTAKQRVSAEMSIATAIQELATQGNVQDVAMLLSEMKDREVAKILTSLSSRDPSLAVRISDEVNAAKQGTVRR